MLCQAVCKRLCPGLTFDDYVLQLKQNPTLKGQAQKARAALEWEQQKGHDEGRVLPIFSPAFEVFEFSQHGHEVYTKAGLLSDTDVVNLTTKSAKDLGLTAFATEWLGPGQSINFYLVSLAGIPSEMKDTIKKVKLFQTTTVAQNKLWLTPSTQLSKSQPKAVMAHLASKYQAQRPKGALQPQELKTLEELQQLAALVESQRLELLQKDAMDPTAALESVDGPVKTGDFMIDGLQDEDDDAGAAKKTKKARVQRAAKTTAPPSESARPKIPSAAAILDAASSGVAPDNLSEAPSGSSKKKRKVDAELDSMDPEMREVAILHMSGTATGSAKSLAKLRIELFVQPGTDHDRGHTLVAASRLRVVQYRHS